MVLLFLICMMMVSTCLNSMLFFPYCACTYPLISGSILNTLIGSVLNVFCLIVTVVLYVCCSCVSCVFAVMIWSRIFLNPSGVSSYLGGW